ncbi:MAG TPA: hypothetical protein VEB22_10610, partial [Phycisphaerales bacterium]|nr:hypothetical protein [Phycisphaerales bacterium]
MKHLTCVFAVTAALPGAVASATPLDLGGSVSPLPYYLNSLGSATLVAPPLIVPFASANFSGSLGSLVVIDAPDNPYAVDRPGCITFIYQIQNDGFSTDAI